MSFQTSVPNKIMTIEDLMRRVHLWRLQDQKIVFTNGCFDLVHRGHIAYLTAAADLGNRLIIGLNTDASVKRLQKGPDRPIQDETSRALVLAAMTFVNAVILFDEDNPENLIRRVTPDILVKGGDYRPDQIVGAPHVIQQGGKVEVIPLVPGYSTSSIEQRLRSR